MYSSDGRFVFCKIKWTNLKTKPVTVLGNFDFSSSFGNAVPKIICNQPFNLLNFNIYLIHTKFHWIIN